jgi:hypothetical protein
MLLHAVVSRVCRRAVGRWIRRSRPAPHTPRGMDGLPPGPMLFEPSLLKKYGS